MKKIMVLLVTFLLMLSLVACKTQDSSNAEAYNFGPSISKVEGKLTVRMFYGPPGYGENPETDKKLYPYIVQLDNPIDVIASEEDDLHSADNLGITEVQVIPSNDQQIKTLNQYVNKAIVVEGNLSEAVLGHAHHTDVVLEIESILINE